MSAQLAYDSGLESIRPLLNVRTIYVKDIDTRLPCEAVQAALEAVCPSSVGRVKVPKDADGNHFAYAYLNFYSQEEGQSGPRPG
jgi:hypothetical protein